LSKLIYLLPDVLLTHPKNLRRFYPDEHVREMADSILAAGGVKQAIQIVPNGGKGKYFVVDGNMRLAGARLLGSKCPRLKCELINETIAEQLLTMVVTANFRYAPDHVSEAMHYQRLISEEGYTVQKIYQATGVHSTIIYNRLKLLKLEPEIQELIGKRKLSGDIRVVDALMSIPNVRARIKLAQKAAKECFTIKAVIRSCERLAQNLKENRPAAGIAPAVVIGKGRSFGKTVDDSQSAAWPEIRKAAKGMCEKCDVRMKSAAEPAWSLIVHASENVCGTCDIREVKSACNQCPGVEMIRQIITLIGVTS